MSPPRTMIALFAFFATIGLAEAAAPPRPRAIFTETSNTEAWNRLPREEPPLPSWARIFVRSHPATTAHLLALDHLHRAKNPLPAAFRAKLRWIAADANRSDYARRYAEFDLRRAGDKTEPGQVLVGDFVRASEKERKAFVFARKMSKGAHTVTDEELAELMRAYGEEGVVAMVHTLAHANFQDRFFLALGISVESGGAIPPLEIRIRDGSTSSGSRRPPWKSVLETKVSFDEVKPDWETLDIAAVRRAVDAQKDRKPRIALPAESRLSALPPALREQSKKIVWTRISMGYQPTLTRAWFATMSSASREGPLDPVFSNSLFWVITRSSDCFY